MTIISTTIILAPAEYVWGALMSPEVSFEWLPSLESIEHFSGRPGEFDSQIQMKYSGDKSSNKIIQKLIAEKPFELIKIVSKEKSATSMVTYELQELDTYTKLKVVAKITSKTFFYSIFFKLTGPFIKQQMMRDFQKLKRVVERRFGSGNEK